MKYHLYRMHGFDRGTRVKLALEASGSAYDMTMTIGGSDEDIATFNKISPFGKSPILITPDGTFFDSAASVLYIKNRSDALIPSGKLDVASNMSWFQFISSSVDSAVIPYFFTKLYLEDKVAAEKLFPAVKELFDKLDEHIGSHDGISSTPETIDSADCMFLYLLSTLNILDEVRQFAKINDYLEKRKNHAAVLGAGIFTDNYINEFMENVLPARRAMIKG